jgi:hypothetical protein
MSIIAEALKKAKDRTENIKISLADVASLNTPKINIHKKNNTIRLAIIFLILFGGLFLASYSWYSLITNASAPISINEETPIMPEQTTKHTYVEKEGSLNRESLSTAIPITISQVNNSLELSGIMYTPKKPLAVINNNIWGVGDTVSGFRILEIKEDAVRVGMESQEFVIKLKK